MTKTELSPGLMDEIRRDLMSGNEPELYWDYRDQYTAEDVIDAIESEPEYPLAYLNDKLDDNCLDYIWETEMSHIEDAIERFRDEIEQEIDFDGDENDYDEFVRELRSDLRDEFLFTVDTNIKDLLRNTTVNVRVTMFSNYDCINSHWLESASGYQYEDSYFGDVVRQLKLDPQKVKHCLITQGVRHFGKWPKRSDKKALVEYHKFWTEIENRSCGANLLTIIGTVDAYDLLTNYNNGKMTITIPKGNPVGFFSSFQGGGSVFECPLLRDVTIGLKENFDDSGYGYWGLKIDDPRSNYSISNVYGVTQGFWGNEIKIHKQKENEQTTD